MAKYSYQLLNESKWVESKVITSKSRRAAKKQLSQENKTEKWNQSGTWKLTKISD